MKNADPKRLPKGKIAYKNDKAQRRTAKLEQKSRKKNISDKSNYSFSGTEIYRLFNDKTTFDVHFPAHGNKHSRADGSDSETAYLYEYDNNRLTEKSKGCSSIHRNETGNTNGAGGGIQGVNIGKTASALQTARQHKKRGAQQDDRGKAQRYDPSRRQLFEKSCHTVTVPFLPFCRNIFARQSTYLNYFNTYFTNIHQNFEKFTIFASIALKQSAYLLYYGKEIM